MVTASAAAMAGASERACPGSEKVSRWGWGSAQGSGGASNTGIFLPRGGTMILLAPRDGKNDYLLWAHMSHLSTNWFELNEFESLSSLTALARGWLVTD